MQKRMHQHCDFYLAGNVRSLHKLLALLLPPGNTGLLSVTANLPLPLLLDLFGFTLLCTTVTDENCNVPLRCHRVDAPVFDRRVEPVQQDRA